MNKGNFSPSQYYDRKYEESEFDPQKFLDCPLKMGKRLYRTRFQVLLDFLKRVNTSSYSILDIGTGEGNVLFTLRDKFSKLYGLDFSQTAFDRAQQIKSILSDKEQNKIFFSCNDANQKLPFDDSSFDVILLLAVLEHVFDPYRVLREAKRVLKPGGMLFLSVPNIAFLKQRIHLLFGKLPLSQPVSFNVKNWQECLWDGGHIHYFTLATLKKLLVEVGLSIEEVRGDGRLAAIGKLLPALLYTNFVVKCTII